MTHCAPDILLSVVIPTFRAADLALQAVSALGPIPDWGELLVVDDGSGDDTVDRLHRRCPHVTVVALAENRGFGGAVNAGFLRARGRFLATLNNDARTSWQDLRHLVEFFDDEPRAGAAAPALRSADGSSQRVAFNFPAPAPAKLLRRSRLATPRGPSPWRVDYAKGACVAFRRSALEQVGLFDEQYWMFAEEIDLFRRLADAGWEAWIVPEAVVTHASGLSTRNHPDRDVSSRYRVHSYKSMCRYWSKHHGPLGALAMRAEMVARTTWRATVAAGRALTGRGDPWWIGEHLRCTAVLLRRWPNHPIEPRLPDRAEEP